MIDIPSTPFTLVAHDLAAAIEVGDKKRALESACLLSELAGTVVDELDDETPYAALVRAARERVLAPWGKT